MPEPVAWFPFTMTFLEILSFTAVVSTIGLFFCGIPICLEIKRKGSTDGISGAPFLMGVLGCFFWLRYGLYRGDSSVINVNVVGFVLQLCYLTYYYSYTRVKKALNQQILFLMLCAVGMASYVQMYAALEGTIINHLGTMCMVLNILNFAAPLAGLREVLKSQTTESLPLPLCAANLVVSAQWFMYGSLVGDPYIKFPNVIGMFLSVLQLSLFLIYPRKRIHESTKI